MKQKKFWQKLIGSLLTILLIVPFSFIQAKAITTNANYSLTQYNYYVEKQGTDWATTDIFVNFKAPASGTLTINISPTLSSNYYSFVVISGGNLAASPTTSTSKLTIGVRSQQNVQIRVQSISTQSNAHATYTMSFSGTYEDGEALSLDNIDASLVTLNGKIDITNNVLAQINTKLGNISTQDYTQILNTINTSIGSIQSAIEDLPDYTSVLNSINSYLNTVNTNVDDIETICSGIQTTVNSILSTLNNIDNLIDTITWKNYGSNYGFLGYSTDGINKQTLSSNVAVSANTPIYLHYHVFESSEPRLMRLITPFYYSSLEYRYYTPELSFYTLYNNNLYEVKNYEAYCQVFFRKSYIYYDGASSGTYDLVIKIQSPYTGLLYSGDIGITVSWIDATDIEYWKIKSALQANAFYQGNAASQQAIDQQESTNQSFESQSNQYHNLESTFQSNFDQSMNAINPGDITNALTQFAPAVSWFTTQLANLYNASGNFKVLFTLPLLLGIALFFIGRGAYAMQHAEHVNNVRSYRESRNFTSDNMNKHQSNDWDAIRKDLFRE